MRGQKQFREIKKKPCQKSDRAGGIAPVLARLSLVGLLLSRAQLRFTKHEVLYATNALFREGLINKKSAASWNPKAAPSKSRDETDNHAGHPPVAETGPSPNILPAACGLVA
jgi:hypothetical protein